MGKTAGSGIITKVGCLSLTKFGILSFMTVTPTQSNLFLNRQELYHFLSQFKRLSLEQNSPQTVSISQQIPSVDPLAVLESLSPANPVCFYWENRCHQEAIAALGTAAVFTSHRSNRFVQANTFIQTSLQNIITTGDLHLKFSGPHFFCSFTFFDNPVSLVSPFPPATIFLPKLQIASHQNRCVLVVNLIIDRHSNLKQLTEQLLQQYHHIRTAPQKLVYHPQFTPQWTLQTNSAKFKKSVASALSRIETQKLHKIVLSHELEAASQLPFNIFGSLNNLRHNYPNCYTFMVSNSQGQSFIGASPERIVKIENQLLETDALAGSAPRGKTPHEDGYFAHALLTNDKEIREHQFVIDFISNCLLELGLSPQKLPLPQLLQLSNIQHLWTPITAELPPGIQPLEILASLHPTPAVAGVPRNIACQEIRQYETFDRSVYAAPLGWIDRRGNSEFVVGIRSAIIAGDRAKLYAGAGIVSGSNPDKELAEIQLKFQPLLKALV